MVFNLVITNHLNKYLSIYEYDVNEWKVYIQSFQDPKTGWFKEGYINYGFHFKEHSSAFATSALKLLGASPKYKFRIRSNLIYEKKVK